MSPDDPTPTGHGLGALLREARTHAGLDLGEVSARTHVRTSYLEALENENLDALPEDVYARNFLRLYARAVGADPQEALSRFDAAKAARAGQARTPERPNREREETGSDAGRPPEAPSSPTAVGGGEETAPRARPAQRTRRTPRAPRFTPGRGRALLTQAAPLLLTLVLAGALVGMAVWGFNRLLFQPTQPSAGPVAEQGAGDEGAAAAGDAGGSDVAEGDLAAPGLPGGGALPDEVLLSVETEPPGAEVTVDAFPLPGATPIEEVPVTARNERTVRITRDGYEPFEDTLDLSDDRSLSVTLTPVGEGEEASVEGEAQADVAVEVNETSWIEAYQSTARGEGERLVYTTAQPGETFQFSRPLYLHVGNAGGIEVTVDGDPIGTLGSGGAVTGQAFPAP